MLTVSCVLSKGPKRSYDASHVERLQEMVAGRVEQPYRFLCLTNEDVSFESLSLVEGWPGWWSKIELFRPGLFKGERDRILYLDLDVTITGRLDDLADYPAPFVIINDWNRFGFNSSVIAWNAGVADRLFTDFDATVMDRLNGDQDWITQKMPETHTFKRTWCVSYKKAKLFNHWNEGSFGPPDMRVLVYHGNPKPWDLNNGNG